jgi:hypothetical protein
MRKIYIKNARKECRCCPITAFCITTANVQGWPGPYTHTVHDLKFGDFPAKITAYIPYIYIWFWPTLQMCNLHTYLWGWPEPHIFTYIRCICGMFGRELSRYRGIYGVHLRSRPILHICTYTMLLQYNDILLCNGPKCSPCMRAWKVI